MKFFKEDPFSKNIRKPTQFKYVKLLRVNLRLISSWPVKELDEKPCKLEGKGYDYYITMLSIVFFISGAWYLVEKRKELTFLELGHIYIVILLNCLATSRAFTLCLSQKYRKVAKKFLLQFHLFYHRDMSEYAGKIYVKVHRFSELFSLYVFSAFMTALFLFNATPVYNNWASGKYQSTADLVNTTYDHPCYFKFPWNAATNLKGYLGGYVIDWYAAYLCGCCVNMFDLFLSIMVFNLWGHFKILIYNLSQFPIPVPKRVNTEVGFIEGSERYSPIEQERVHVLLKECVLYHKEITGFTNQMSDAFGISLLSFYVFHQVTGCLMLLECSQMSVDALARFGPLTIIMWTQLIQTSVIFETIGAMSEKLKDAVYFVPWEYMNTRNRSTFLLFYVRVQEPIHMKAGGMVIVGVTTMASILKTSFSYFAFLRTFSE